MACIAEDDLLDLAHARRPLGDAPVLEAHLADCAACSALLCTLIAAPREPRADLVGCTLGPYRLDGVIGAGAMGEVYRGWDLRLQRHVAVKVLSRRLGDAPDGVRRLEAEGRAAAAIAHRNVVTVYDTGSDDGVPYIVSELIAGESLRSLIDRGPIPRRTALDLGLQLARGLAAAHAQGVIHRDLKPGNLIVTDDGTLKILDFGLAKLGGDRDLEATEPGTLLGTSGYLAPEQARGEPADARSDLFAVGAILHELLTGRRAFGGATFAERISAVLRDTPPAVDDPAGPAIARCLDKDPRKRFQSAHDLAWVLEGLRDQPAYASEGARPANIDDVRANHGTGSDAPATTDDARANRGARNDALATVDDARANRGTRSDAASSVDDARANRGTRKDALATVDNARANRGTRNDAASSTDDARANRGARSEGLATVDEARRAGMVSRRTFLVGAAATGAAGVLVGRVVAPGRRAFVPAYRQLTFRQGRVPRARFTPDGGSVLYTALWEDRPQAIYTARLAGGGTRALELPAAQLLAVSSRGQLALSIDHRYVEGFHQRGQLALAPLEGGEPRGLGVEVQDADFSPGGELAIVRRVDGRFRLESPVGRVLLEAGWLSHPRVSPDGALVAVLVHDAPDDDRGDVAVVPRTGGAARTLAAGWSSVDGLTWAPGGRALWISASRGGGNNAVRALALDGRALAHLPSAGRLRVHDAAPDGQLAVTHVSGRLRMVARAPGGDEVELGLSDVTMITDIAGDGRSVVFGEFGDVDTARGAYLRPTTGGAALRLGDGFPLDLADDGRGVLALLHGPPPTLAAFPVPDGQPRPLPVPGLTDIRAARWGAADRLVVIGARAGRPLRLWRRDPDALAPLTDEGIVGRCAVSPDGRLVALIAHDRLLVIDIATAAARTVPGLFPDESVCGWSGDGADIFLRTKPAPIRVRRVHTTTAATAPVLELAPPRLGLRGIDALVVSHAGDAYAYSYGQELSRLYTMTTEDPGE